MATITFPITNQASCDVDIYAIFHKDKTSPLVYTKLGSLATGQTQSFQTDPGATLQAMRTGAIDGLNGNYYYQFPVAAMIAGLTEKSHTITEDEREGMEQAFLFQKYVSANANSVIALQFLDRLKAQYPQPTDRKAQINEFFANSKNFKKCTLAAWTAVMEWQTQFTSAWQGPYYLYSVPEQGDNTPPSLMATVIITSTAIANTAVLTPANSSQKINLEMNGAGLQEANVGVDSTVTLTPVWLNVIQTGIKDKKMDTRYLIGGGLTGTFAGQAVCGTGQSRNLSPKEKAGKTQDEIDREEAKKEKEFDRRFSHITTIASLIVGVITAYLFFKQTFGNHAGEVKKAAAKPGGPTQEDLQRVDAETDADIANDGKPIADRAIQDAHTLETANQGLAATAKQDAADDLQDVLDARVEDLEAILEAEPASEITRSAAQTIRTAQESLAEGDIDDAFKQLDEIDTDIGEALKDASSLGTDEATALQEAQEAIQEGKTQNESIENAEAEQTEATQEDPEDLELGEEDFDDPQVDMPEGEL